MRRQFYYVLFFLSAIIACTPNYNSNTKVTTTITFDKFEHDFGTVKMNSHASVDFIFSNAGGTQLIISRVVTSCDCAKPVWPKKPVKPGKTGIISIKYDTSYPGRFIKTIKVYANVENNPIELKVMGAVE